MIYFISLIFFFVNLSFAKDSTTAGKQKKTKPFVVERAKEEKAKPSVAKTTEKKEAVPSAVKKTKKKKTKPKRKASSVFVLEKQDLLPKDYAKPKYSARVLNQDLEEHLTELSSICDQTGPSLSLKFKLNQIRDFLKDRLQDPYMDVKAEHLFRDILMLIGEESLPKSFTATSFKSAYKIAFGIRREIKSSDYPEWAFHIEKALLCTEEETASK